MIKFIHYYYYYHYYYYLSLLLLFLCFENTRNSRMILPTRLVLYCYFYPVSFHHYELTRLVMEHYPSAVKCSIMILAVRCALIFR